MNKKIWYFVIVIIIIAMAIATCIFLKNKNNSSDNNFVVNTTKLATSNSEQPRYSINSQNSAGNLEAEKKPIETELASYSTPLKSKASGRLNNIRITCSALNGTIVSSKETFSFCNTLGSSTSEKGYQKADVIQNGEIIQALGGGNCQVSSTLYNVVLAIPELEVVERHEHGKDVTYVPDGKDAAVSYGSMDLKFKNNFSEDVKIYLSSDDVNVTASIFKVTHE